MAYNFQHECLKLAVSLDSVFTSPGQKLKAAAILREIGTEEPHCCWCGQKDVSSLSASPINPRVFICTACTRIALYGCLTHDWERLQGFAP
jgi:hypothetical protein